MNRKAQKEATKEATFRDFLPGDLSSYKGEFEPEISQNLNYTGQIACLRKLGLELFGAEKVALMSDSDLAEEVQKIYAVVACEGEDIHLVERSMMSQYESMVKHLSR